MVLEALENFDAHPTETLALAFDILSALVGEYRQEVVELTAKRHHTQR